MLRSLTVVRQFLNNHQAVGEKEYTGKAVKLPEPEEIPNVNMQVINYHRPLLGTFHAKFMVVDRRVATLCSNNIQVTVLRYLFAGLQLMLYQDIDNLEMMTHLEGPIVDSVYEMALISWNNAFDTSLPTHNRPAASQHNGGRVNGSTDLGHEAAQVNNGLSSSTVRLEGETTECRYPLTISTQR
jgi:hypothetical protein